MGSTSEELMDYSTMVTTTATSSFTMSSAGSTTGPMYGTGGSTSSSSSFSPYFGTAAPHRHPNGVSESRSNLTTTSTYSGTIMSSTTEPVLPSSFAPVTVRPMHDEDSGHKSELYASPYPRNSPSYELGTRPEELDTKPASRSSPQRSPHGPSPLPPVSPSSSSSATKRPHSPENTEKTVNYEELRMKIAYKKFERDCIMEFDGDTVLCRVCGDKASGFHYGVHACEGCKGFFRRSIQQKIQYRPCLKNQQCNIMRVNRNRCQYCRLKKCIAVGMSRDAVRFGRVPKKEKAKILEQMQKVNQQSQHMLLSSVLDQDPGHFVQKIIDAHLAICPFSHSKFAAFYEKAWSSPSFVDCPSHMACPLKPAVHDDDPTEKWEDFSDSFTPAIRNVVSFAKQIPGFTVFNQEDQVTLLKAGTFEVLLLHLACLFDTKNGAMLFTNGKMFKRSSSSAASVASSTGGGFLLDSMFDFAERLNELKLTDEETALFCAIVVIASDRPGLRNMENIERVQTRISGSLHAMMKAKHPDDPAAYSKLLALIPDLRTLNTLHSEKLGNLTVPEKQERSEVVEETIKLAPEQQPMTRCPYPPPMPPNGVTYGPALNGSPVVPHLLSPSALLPSVSDAAQQVVLQTSMGTFHRYNTSPPPQCKSSAASHSNRSSPDPLEMDLPPPPPPPMTSGSSAGGHHHHHPPPASHHHHHQHHSSPPPLLPIMEDRPVKPAMDSLHADMQCKMAQLYNLWEFDMRSNRSNSLSSTSSTESSGSVDSAYRSAPGTPPRSALVTATGEQEPDTVPSPVGSSAAAAAVASAASVLKQALSMPPLVAQHTWFHHPPPPPSMRPQQQQQQQREDLHRSVLELSRRAAQEAMKGGPPLSPLPLHHPHAAAAAAAMMYQQQQQQQQQQQHYVAAMQQYMQQQHSLPHPAGQARSSMSSSSVSPPASHYPHTAMDTSSPLNLSSKASPPLPKVKVEPI